jgi:two-component system, chemotaxis family, CheB/CheR fusion protein
MGIHAQPVFSRHAAEASFWRSVQAPTSSSVADELRAALELARPGFMAFTAMREGERIVDFVWSFVSTAAGRILGRNALDLYGKRLRVELAGQDGCAALFEQYRRVVVQGSASATQVHQVHGRHDIYRHGAVRVGDGVAVTLINVSAAHRAHALGLALHAQHAAKVDEPSRMSWKSI